MHGEDHDSVFVRPTQPWKEVFRWTTCIILAWSAFWVLPRFFYFMIVNITTLKYLKIKVDICGVFFMSKLNDMWKYLIYI
jgi:hypothetical protein